MSLRRLCALAAAAVGAAALLVVPLADASDPVITADWGGYTLGTWTNANVTGTFSCTPDPGLNAVLDPASETVTTQGANQSIHVTCTDDDTPPATAAADFGPINIDKTDPSITDQGPGSSPNANGWYNGNVVNTFGASDGLSGLSSACNSVFPKDVTASAEGAAVSVGSGTCADNAGNSAAAINSGAFKIDKTDPTISDQGPTTQPNGAGWYNGNVVNGFAAADGLSGLSSACDTAFPKQVTASAEGAAVTVGSGTCADKAGNSAPANTGGPFKIDKTDPTISNQGPTPAQPNGDNGWYTSNVVVHFGAADGLSGLSSACDTAFPKPVTASAEGAAVTVGSGTCADKAGNSAAAINSGAFKIDKTDPTINATAKKQDGTAYDAGTETPQDVTIHFACADAGSGIANCPQDRTFNTLGTTSVSGTATDKAGNTGTDTFGLVKIVPYGTSAPPKGNSGPSGSADHTAPDPVKKAAAKPGDHMVVLTWVPPSASDLDYVEVRRSVAGKPSAKTVSYKAQSATLRISGLSNNVTYRFALVAYDTAGNASGSVVLSATPAATLLATPKAGTKVVEPPLLRWAPVTTADYFNVQLYRGGVKVLSAWPRFAHLQLTNSWTYDKKAFRLKPGKYSWYVWPGLGKRAAKRYGPLLGKSTFVVTTSAKT